jgi:hypothetical protein
MSEDLIVKSKLSESRAKHNFSSLFRTPDMPQQLMKFVTF